MSSSDESYDELPIDNDNEYDIEDEEMPLYEPSEKADSDSDSDIEEPDEWVDFRITSPLKYGMS